MGSTAFADYLLLIRRTRMISVERLQSAFIICCQTFSLNSIINLNNWIKQFKPCWCHGGRIPSHVLQCLSWLHRPRLSGSSKRKEKTQEFQTYNLTVSGVVLAVVGLIGLFGNILVMKVYLHKDHKVKRNRKSRNNWETILWKKVRLEWFVQFLIERLQVFFAFKFKFSDSIDVDLFGCPCLLGFLPHSHSNVPFRSGSLETSWLPKWELFPNIRELLRSFVSSQFPLDDAAKKGNEVMP